MRHLLSTIAATAMLAGSGLAQTANVPENLEKLSNFQTTGVTDFTFIERQSEYLREELRRLDFIPCRHNGVIEFDRHERPRCAI